MPIRSLFCRIRSRRLLAPVILAGLVIGFGAPNAWAWYHLRAARSALKRYHPEEARSHLADSLKIWPGSVHTHLLASQAARQDGDFVEAERHVRECQSLTGDSSDEIALEWALLQAAAGNVREVEEYLVKRTERVPESAPIVWEALAEGYIRIYRMLDAYRLIDYWLRVDPENLRAFELRGLAFQNAKSASKGAESFRQVLAKDPTREATRWRLVLCLLEMGSYDEAMPILETIAANKPGDPEVQVRLARCYNMVGRSPQAREILDKVILENPEHGLALRTRGQFAMGDQRPDLAETWLARGVEAWPNDYQTRWLYYESLRQQKKTDQAKAQLLIAEVIKDRSERLGDLRSRKLSEKPLDPALHYEMGILLLRTGYESIGESWLLSALSLDPEYSPAHLALADYYQKKGDNQRAEEHRRQVKETAKASVE